MSLQILKPGLLDTIQDRGRFGYAHLGINPSGAMDPVAMAVANALVGNPPGEAVLEMHFPAPLLRFGADALLALAGADFDATLNGHTIPVHAPVLAQEGTMLEFRKPRAGARGYLAVAGGFDIEPWLGSRSTHLAAQAGGWQGRALRAGDDIPFRLPVYRRSGTGGTLPWKANVAGLYTPGPIIRFCPGPEYGLLRVDSQKVLETAAWKIALQSDRMGCRTEGPALRVVDPVEMVSAAVVRGTMQLLPNGQFIILMADGQTTGGYPRIGVVIGADLPKLAQMPAGESIRLERVDIKTAFDAYVHQMQYLVRLTLGCRYLPLNASLRVAN